MTCSKREPFEVAIVGGGPSACYALSMLVAALPRAQSSMAVVVFEPSGEFGNGTTHSRHQPAYSVMNRDACDIALTPDPGGFAFLDWIAEANGSILGTHDVVPNAAPPRALVGAAFGATFERHRRLLEQAGIRVLAIPRAVARIEDTNDGTGWLAITTAGAPGPSVIARHVLLATGHDRLRPSPEMLADMHFAASRPSLRYLPAPYPLTDWEDCGSVGGERVALRGMGLSAIDAILHLTEGRGGTFARVIGGALRYVPSGREPRCIIPTGRSGLPVTTRPVNARARQGSSRPLALLTAERINRLRMLRPEGLDFEANILPLIVGDMAILFHSTGPEGVEEAPLAVVGIRGADEDAVGVDRLAWQINLAARAAGSTRRFDWRALLFAQDVGGVGTPHDRALGRIREDLVQARAGNMLDPIKAAIDGVWRDGRPVLCDAVDFGGLTPASEESFRRLWLRIYHRLSNGAPIAAMEKLAALAEAGAVDLSAGFGAQVLRDPSGYWCVEGTDSGYRKCVDMLIEARIAGFDPDRSLSPLYRDMITSGLLTRWRDEVGAGLQPIAIDRRHRAISRSGVADPRIVIVGTPIEGTRYFQESLARPGGSNATLEALSAWSQKIVKDLADASHHHAPQRSPGIL